MKNIFEYIHSLPLTMIIIGRIIDETIKEKGEEYLVKERTDFEMQDFPFCILFVWNKTPEGFEYWNQIDNAIRGYGN